MQCRVAWTHLIKSVLSIPISKLGREKALALTENAKAKIIDRKLTDIKSLATILDENLDPS
eukprot:gene5189-7044_t